MFPFRQQISFIIIIIGTIFLGSFVLEGCKGKNSTTGPVAESKPKTTLPNNSVAVVNGVSITHEKFDLAVSMYQATNPERFRSMPAAEREKFLSMVMDRIIVDTLLIQEAKLQGLEVSEETVEQEYETLKARFPSEKAFLDTLQKARTSPEIWKKGMRHALLMRKLDVKMADRLEVRPEEIQSFWDGNRQFLQQDRVHARQIVVRTAPEAKQVLAALKGGSTFEVLVKAYSIDPLTKAQGGDLGWISRNEASEGFKTAVFSLKPQSVSAPFKNRNGYYIVRVLDKKMAGETSLDDYREKIRGIIQQQKWQAQRPAWLKSLKDQATIVQ